MLMLAGIAATAQQLTDEAPAPPTGLQFEYAHQLSLSADDARNKQQYPAALVLYQEAIKEYDRLINLFPDWQPGMSRFRSAYCRQERNIILDRTGLTVSNAMASVTDDLMDRPSPAQGTVPGGSQAAQSRMPRLKSDARRLIKEGKSEQARDLLLGALKIAPDDETLRLMIATAQCQHGHFEDAVYILEGLIIESPSNANAHLVLGTAYFALGETKTARRSIERSVELNPQSREGHYNLARMLVIAEVPEWESAESHYQEALKLGAHPDHELEARLLEISRQAPAPDASKR